MTGGGIDIRILGDFGPFSRTGKSIGYQINVGGSSFLIDCGSPLFNVLGGHRLAGVDGLIITHCHDDHKRWFSDLALFHRYAPDVANKIFLLTSEDVLGELATASAPAIDRSLSSDSSEVVDIAFDEYVETRLIGPAAKYRIVRQSEGDITRTFVADSRGNPVGPDTAKVVVNPKTGRPRMLYRDPESGEWVEPESYYPYSSVVFYERDRRNYRAEGLYTIEAVKSPVWHGISGIGIKVSTGKETLFITSDTVHDIELWERLAGEKRRKPAVSNKGFESASVIYGDINDYIERAWSRERYDEACRCFSDCIVVHDVSAMGSIVHTDYERLNKTLLDKGRTILTHSPDRMTSEWALCYSGKTYRVKGKEVFEVVDGVLYPLDADIYHKEKGRYYVGYRSPQGRYTVYRSGNSVNLFLKDSFRGNNIGEPYYGVDLYEDIAGHYFPVEERHDREYVKRSDGKVELVEYSGQGSKGTVVEGSRRPVAADVKETVLRRPRRRNARASQPT